MKVLLLIIKILSFLNYIQSIFIMIHVILSSYSFISLESEALVQLILPNLIQMPPSSQDNHPIFLSKDTDINQVNDLSCSSITVQEQVLKELNTTWNIAGYQHLQYVYINNGSCKNISSVCMQNLPKLAVIVVERDAFVNTSVFMLNSNELIICNESIFLY